MKICNSINQCEEERKILFRKGEYQIKECKTCGHRFCQLESTQDHVAKVYSDGYFFDGNDGYFNYYDEKNILIKKGSRYAKLVLKHTGKPGKLLDTGCAAGFIMKGFEKQGWIAFGIEPNKTMVDYGKRVHNQNITLGSYESFTSSTKFDLITMIQVIGHFHDIDKAMQNTYNFLKPGGFVLVESWNMNSPIVKILKKNWQEYSPPSVINWFSDKTLVDLFAYYKFKLVEKGLPIKYINIKHALSLFGNKTSNAMMKQRIMNALTRLLGKINIFYPPVDIKWYLFQRYN